jgi:hypothetical protein
MKSASSKSEFSKQFDNIVRGVEESLKRQEHNHAQKQSVVEQHKQIYQNVLLFCICFFVALTVSFSFFI